MTRTASSTARLFTACAAVLIAVLALATAPRAHAAGDTLKSEQTVASGGVLQSAGGRFLLSNQGDGNVVLYDDSGRARWATRTNGKGASTLQLQGDGNLVLTTQSGAVTWTSKTAGSLATSLAVQDDGNVVLRKADGTPVWATNTVDVPAPVSLGNALAAGGTLTTQRYLTSTNGLYTLTLNANGRLVVGTGARSLWAVPGGISTAVTAAFQPDGNLVLYDSKGAPQWATNVASATAGQLVMQDDGNLVAYTKAGTPYWASGSVAPANPAPGSDRMVAGQQLVPGASLVAASGGWTFVQQKDGNAVVYGPQGATWSTNSGGFGGVVTVLQKDGNLVTYSGSGTPLWAAGTNSAATLVMQGDGNLVLYSGTGAPVWSSRYSPAPPPLFAPVTSAPPAATSRYLRNLTGGSGDAPFMRTAGCTDARANPGGRRYLTFLAFGAQVPNVNGVWGVNLTAGTGLISNGAVVNAVKAYIDGYTSCMAGYSLLTISVGTNNDGPDSGLGATGGQIWGDQVIDPLMAYAASVGGVSIAAANDIEPGFNGTLAQAYDWMSGYLGATTAPFVNTGSADGCPQTLGSTAPCNNGWTVRSLYDLTWGLMPTRSLPLPQIYFTSMANQWANISLVGGLATGSPISYAGPLTEVTACQQANSCTSMSSTSAWNTLWSKLQADPRIKQSDLPYTTDLRIDR